MLPGEYGSGSTCHRRFQEWVGLDIFKKVWIRLLQSYDNKKGIKWTWQSLDSISIKSPLGGAMTGSNPTDRSKLGTKRHILTDKKGIPLSVVISSASTHDIKLVTDVMDNMIIKRSSSSTKRKLSRKRKLQHLCLDKAYNSKTAKQEIIKPRICTAFTVQEKKRRGQDRNTKDVKSKKTSC